MEQPVFGRIWDSAMLNPTSDGGRGARKTSIPSVTEGIDVFRAPLPPSLVGLSIAESQIRPKTGCSIVALELPESTDPVVSPPPETVLAEGMGLILIGSPEEEENFGHKFRVN